MSFKSEVRTGKSLDWNSNVLRFETKAEAEAYVLDLMMRWTSVTETRVVKSSDPVNYQWEGGRAKPLPVIFAILYPEQRSVSENTIRLWYGDAVANGELEAEDEEWTMVEEMAKALDRAGVITLAKVA